MMENSNQPLLNNGNPYAPGPTQGFSNDAQNQQIGVNPYSPNQNAKPTDGADYMEYRNSEFAEDLNKLKPKESSCHCQSLWATILLLGGEATGLILYFKSDVDLSTDALIGICVGSYLLYLIVGLCCNPLREYLSNIDRGENFETYYQQVRAMIGRFRFHAECYHYEIRHHTRTVRDANGNTRHEHYTTREKVVTHVATEYLTPYDTKDVSGNVDRIRANTNVVFIHFYVRYRFADPQSSNNFERAYYNFKMRHTRDAHQDFSSGYEVPGLIARKAFFVGELSCNFGTWLYVFGFFGLLWPYSLWVESKISRFDVESMKVLKV